MKYTFPLSFVRWCNKMSRILLVKSDDPKRRCKREENIFAFVNAIERGKTRIQARETGNLRISARPQASCSQDMTRERIYTLAYALISSTVVACVGSARWIWQRSNFRERQAKRNRVLYSIKQGFAAARAGERISRMRLFANWDYFPGSSSPLFFSPMRTC